ncbi:MAG TPA: glycoside hydrolase family 30 beta sandwich domain-containing protein [Flavitalea sp.]|nr:glycoside hydrolase family 30 beta sandwich domain-containing protein [Flavitalea sp.]
MKFTNYITVLLIICMLNACSNKNAASNTPQPLPVIDTSSAKVVYWITTSDESVLLQRQPALGFSTTSNSNQSITIDTSQAFQEMDGFGYTLTSGSATLINDMSSAAKANLLAELFGNSEISIHVSYLRLSIGASDLSSQVYTYDDMPAGQTDPDLNNFSLDPDKADLIPLLREIIAINPGIKIIAAPWTAPVWMKDNQSSIGGSLKPEYYRPYAKYFEKYVLAMKAEGITITAITPQNEPLNPGNNPSLVMNATQQADFIKNHLGPVFQAASINTKIILYDHNCDKPDYPLAILNDAAAKAFVDGSAFHLYAGNITALLQVHNAHPDKNVYFTEQYTANTSEFGGDLHWHIKNLVIGAPRNWSRTVFEWNLANDVNFGPHTDGGCTTCKGALTINGSAVKRNVAYYIIAHISKFVPPGSVRIQSNITGSLQNVAFKTPSGQKTLIVMNDGSAASVFNVSFNGKSASASLPAGAVGTYIIN